METEDARIDRAKAQQADEKVRVAADPAFEPDRGLAPDDGYDRPSVPSAATGAIAHSARGFRSDIQGLRALAVIPVVLYHAFADWVPGGFVGVDVFFVISGYLITGILLEELSEQRYSITAFYARRVKRIFPALYALLLAVLPAGILILPSAELVELGKTAFATVFFLSNIAFLLLSGYFDGAAELKPLLHTWSLAVEEQFYVIFPLALALIARISRRHIGAILWIGAVASAALCIWGTRDHESAAFYLPVTRAYELLIGSILAAAAVPSVRSAVALNLMSVAGLVMIAWSIMTFNRDMTFPGAAALIPCIGAGLIIYAGQGRISIAGRILSHPILVFFGAISYSLYLWHWPILALERHLFLGEMTAPRVIGALVLTMIAATLSWRYVERPVLRLKLSNARTLGLGVAMIAVGAAVSGALVLSKGMPARFDDGSKALFAATLDSNPFAAKCHSGDKNPIPYARNCVFGRSGSIPRIAVWGDSFGAELALALGERAGRTGEAVMQITASACPPALGFNAPKRPHCAAYNQLTLDSLAADTRIQTVVMIGNFDVYPIPTQGQLMRGFADAARALRSAGKKIVLVYPVPTLTYPGPQGLGLTAWRGSDPASFGVSAQAFATQSAPFIPWLDRLAQQVAAGKIEPRRGLCTSTLCRAFVPGIGSTYVDQEHMSLKGVGVVLDAAGVAIDPGGKLTTK